MAKPYGKPTSGPAWWAAFVRQKIAEGWTAPYDGGLADGYSPVYFDIRSLAQGIGVEREHTRSDEKALRIAMDHLAEDPCYYDKLKWMEANPLSREANPLGNLPAKASRMWEHVYESAQERGLSKSASAAQAWCAVKRQYYKKGDRWRKRKAPLSKDKYPPGCTPFRKKEGGACCDACAVGEPCTGTNPEPYLEDWLHENAERFRDDYGYLDEDKLYNEACEKFCREGLGRWPQKEDPEFSRRFYGWLEGFGDPMPKLTKLKNKLLR